MIFFPENGNIWTDPLFCDPENYDVHLKVNSPRLPGEHSGHACDLIGACGSNCGDTPVEVSTWGRIKHSYREGR